MTFESIKVLLYILFWLILRTISQKIIIGAMDYEQNELTCTSTSPELEQSASTSFTNLLPNKSAQIYEKQYEAFLAWAQTNNIENYNEDVFITFFTEKAKTHKSSTLWSTYSMLKSTFSIKHNIDISKYSNLLAFIKHQNIAYKPKKSDIFTREEINKFLNEANDYSYLMWKLCLIIGISGSCRMDELKKLTVDDIQDKENILIITISDSKNGKKRVFTLTNKMCDNFNPIDSYRNYMSLRPRHTQHRSFFIYYRNGKCSVQPVGIHTLSKIPRFIAEYLKLPDPKAYTGHALRRTSASLSAYTGSDLLSLKQQRGSKRLTIPDDDDHLNTREENSSEILQGSVWSAGTASTIDYTKNKSHEDQHSTEDERLEKEEKYKDEILNVKWAKVNALERIASALEVLANRGNNMFFDPNAMTE